MGYEEKILVWRKEPKIQDIYLRLLDKLYRFLARRTNSTFSQIVLFMSLTNQPPLPLSWMIQKMKLPVQEDKTAVVVGTITHDVRVQEVPKLKVHVLPVGSHALGSILRAGGKNLTFDQLTPDSLKGCDTVLLSSPHKGLEYTGILEGWEGGPCQRAQRYKNRIKENFSTSSYINLKRPI
uniref:Large ribosomal subunit protein uL15/eL18 domain-containing protein n=1 Tax=Ursus maritimus TaxID=29073 RepID=A0A452VKA9_URSMA